MDIETQKDKDKGVQLWHGAQKWSLPISINPSKLGSYECGPGIYTTTKKETALKYAAGSGSVILFELKKDIKWLEDTSIDYKLMTDFIKSCHRLKNKEDILSDLDSHIERMRLRNPEIDTIKANIMVNLMVNYQAITGKPSLMVVDFLQEMGVNASLGNSFYGEDWVVIINPNIIKSSKQFSKKELDHLDDFKTIKDQLLDIEKSVTQLNVKKIKKNTGFKF